MGASKMYRVNVYVNASGTCDIQGEVYNSRADCVNLIDNPAPSLDSAIDYLNQLRDKFDCEFSIAIYRSA